MMKKLWGDNFFDAKTKKWRTSSIDDEGNPLKRAFVHFIMDPICKLANSIVDNEVEIMSKMLKDLNLTLS